MTVVLSNYLFLFLLHIHLNLTGKHFIYKLLWHADITLIDRILMTEFLIIFLKTPINVIIKITRKVAMHLRDTSQRFIYLHNRFNHANKLYDCY